MEGVLILLGGVAVVLAITISYSRRRSKRRRELMEGELTSQQSEWIERHWESWPRLPAEVRKKVEGLSRVFLDEKVFEPCGGISEVSEEMRYLVAAQASLLWHNQKGAPYPALKAILMYPDAYRARQEHGGSEVRLGESWSSGTVVLAWNSVRGGARDEDDGHNLVFHEFAHQLDTVNGPADGFPVLPKGADLEDWSEVFKQEYENLIEDIDRRRPTVLDGYGTKNEAEFFAVATEAFFEKPEKMVEEHEELYRLLVGFYGLDPAKW